jgi:hypothetical protein
MWCGFDRVVPAAFTEKSNIYPVLSPRIKEDMSELWAASSLILEISHVSQGINCESPPSMHEAQAAICMRPLTFCMDDASGFVYAGGLWLFICLRPPPTQEILGAANRTRPAHNWAYFVSCKKRRSRVELVKMNSKLAKGTARGPEVKALLRVLM